MTLNLYNTLTRKLENFSSIEPGLVNMYCCGITVYDYCHLGHARTCIVWDVVRRYFEWLGYKVRYIQNFTDIDDKILNRAKAEATTMEAVAERFIQAYFEDMDRLGVRKADAYPRATHHLDGIKRLVYELEQKGYAYPAMGDVYYAVSKFSSYGKLSGRKLDDMQAGASGRVDPEDPEGKKREKFDFALWKASKPEEPFWESPWGPGRPGWHIECSAMVREKFGETIDIHVGGSDLIFPHHENEIAQSEAATGMPLASFWLHNGMVKVEGEKMSKSLGNFITIRDLLDRPFDPMAVRLFILQAHYSKPLDFTEESLQAATNGWQTLKEGLLFGEQWGDRLGWKNISTLTNDVKDSYKEKFEKAVNEDLNFTSGLAVLFEIAKTLRREGNILNHQGNTETDSEILAAMWITLKELATVLGFSVQKTEKISSTDELEAAEIERIIEQRAQARKAKNFAEGDRLRDELKAKGIVLVDQPGGLTKWHRQ